MPSSDSIESFKRAAGRFASGVTIAATRHKQGFYGITCSSFTSLSLNPLLVQVSVHAASPFIDVVSASEVLAVSVLSARQEAVSRYFATRSRGLVEGGFPGIPTESFKTGAPVISGALSWFDARLHAIIPGGDHMIVIGEVVATGGGNGDPLLYWSGGYRQIGVGYGPDPLAHFADAISVHLHLGGLTPAQLLEAQGALEPAAAQLAAQRCHPSDLRALEEALSESRLAASNPAAFTAAATRFHDALGPASGNPALAAAIKALTHTRRDHYASGTTPTTVRRTIDAHQEILAAIAFGDARAARDSIARHLAVISRRLRESQ